MTLRGAGQAPSRIALAVLLAAVLLAVAVGPPGSHGSASAVTPGLSRAVVDVAPPGGPSWDNGIVRLTFSDPYPSFTVSSDHDGRVASYSTLTAIAEVNPKGNVTTIAHFHARNVTWAFSSHPVLGGTVVSVDASIPVAGSHGGWESDDGFPEDQGPVGKAFVLLTFFLNGSSQANSDAVRFTVNVTHWPWSSASNTLGLEMGTTALGTTRLVTGSSANQLQEVRSGTTSTVSTLSWDSEASVSYNGTGLNTSAVGTFQDLALNGSNSTIRLSFGSVGGGYTQLSYDPSILLNLSAFQPPGLTHPVLLRAGELPAWQLTAGSLEVVSLGLALVSVLAVVAWRSRTVPPPPP